MYDINKYLQNFRKNKEGNISMIFGLSVVVFIGIVGFAVDISRALQAQSALQNTIDKAALSLAQDYGRRPDLQGPSNQANRIAYIQKWIDINHGVKKLNPTFSMVLGSKKEITIDAQVSVPTTLLAIMHKNYLNVDSHSQAVASAGRAEIALVLDTTGSMNPDADNGWNNKMAALKLAATTFTNTLFDQSGSEDNLKMAVVPFNEFVNVGMSHGNAAWLRKPAQYQEDESWTYLTFCRNIGRTRTCRGIIRDCTDDDSETGCWSEAYDWCTNGGPGETRCNELKEGNLIKWNGCVSPRKRANNINQSFNTNDNFEGSANKKKYPGKIGGCSVEEMLPLSDEKATVLSKINTLNSGEGKTHIPVGLAWGWHLLSKDAPFTSGAASDDKTWSKYIVLMTDGKNSPYNHTVKPNGDEVKDGLRDTHWNGPEIPFNKYYKRPNQSMARLCTNIKAAGIKIFTIAFDITDPGIKNRLKACATDETFYQDAGGGVSLADAFKNISDSISNLRLSH